MSETLPCLEGFTRCCIRFRYVVLGFWLVVTLGLAYPAAKFMEILKITLDAPPGSKSEAAQVLFDKHYPQLEYNSQAVGYLEVDSGDISKVPGLDDYIRDMQKRLNELRPLSSFISTTTVEDLTKPLAGTFPPLKLPLISHDKSALLLTYSVAMDPASQECRDWALTAHELFMKVTKEKLGNHLSFYGTNSYSEAAAQAITQARADMERCDAVSLPCAAIILLVVVESCRLLLIPGLALAVSCVASFSSMWFVGQYFQPVQAITPSLMMCLIISMTIDYSIFLLTRFREEINLQVEEVNDDLQAQDIEAAICTTMATSGATILLSGFTLSLAFVFVAFFPISLIASMGVGSCITMWIMVAVNLTLSPTLLATFPRFFMKGVEGKDSALSSSLHRASEGLWSWTARNTTAFPNNLILLVVVVAATALCTWPVRDVMVTMDMRQAMAAGTNLRVTSDRIDVKFGGGLAYPYQVLILPNDPSDKVLSNKFFERSGNLLKDLSRDLKHALPEVAEDTSINFISFRTDVGMIPYDRLAALCQLPGISKDERMDPEDAALFDPLCSYFLNSFTNVEDFHSESPTALYGIIIAGADPLGTMGNSILDFLREACERLGPKYDIQIAIGGTPTKALDMIATMYEAMKPAVLGTYAAAAVLLGVSFRSLITPVRAVLSSLLTLGISYGLTKLVFQDGILSFLGYDKLSNHFHSLPWFPPVVAFFVITGIGLDYDIFLLVRVTEFRARGLDPDTAIRKGLVSTAGIITAAGVVMVIAFGGMCFSALVNANMFGFLLVTAVLYDTFIARSLVNPAVMSLLGYSNWWPTSLSEPTPLHESSNGVQRLDKMGGQVAENDSRREAARLLDVESNGSASDIR